MQAELKPLFNDCYDIYIGATRYGSCVLTKTKRKINFEREITLDEHLLVYWAILNELDMINRS